MNNVRTEFRLTFGVNINIDSANLLRSRIAQILERGDFGSLTILFSSEGGSTDHSLELFNFISQLPVSVHMHGMGHIGSSAVPVFLAGTKRTCSPFARFFFHQYDWGFLDRQTLHRIDEAVKRLRSDIDMARQIIMLWMGEPPPPLLSPAKPSRCKSFMRSTSLTRSDATE